MFLVEHASKLLLAEFGIPCGAGALAASPEEAVDAAERVGFPVAVKAQVPAGGRGKAGAIASARTGVEARDAFTRVTSVAVDGLVASRARIEAWRVPVDELYLAIAVDAALQCPVVLVSRSGGVEVESGRDTARIALREDGTVPAAGLRSALYEAGLGSTVEPVVRVAAGLARAFAALDARVVELNPLSLLEDGSLCATDAKLIVDDHALFRQPRVRALAESTPPHRVEDLVRESTRLEYVPLEGRIGLLSGGAGMTMAVMDAIAAHGERAACFLDCSNNPTYEGYGAALDLLRANPGVEAILISIFGGLTQVDRVARSLVRLLRERGDPLPVTLRLMGTNVEAAEAVLASAGHRNHRSLEEAVSAAVASVGHRGEEAVDERAG